MPRRHSNSESRRDASGALHSELGGYINRTFQDSQRRRWALTRAAGLNLLVGLMLLGRSRDWWSDAAARKPAAREPAAGEPVAPPAEPTLVNDGEHVWVAAAFEAEPPTGEGTVPFVACFDIDFVYEYRN